MKNKKENVNARKINSDMAEKAGEIPEDRSSSAGAVPRYSREKVREMVKQDLDACLAFLVYMRDVPDVVDMLAEKFYNFSNQPVINSVREEIMEKVN